MYLLPSTYFGNIFFWNTISKEKKVCIDQGEFFTKQTFRNRAEVCTEKGIMPLIIPLEKGKNSKQHMSEVRISYNENWRALHLKTIRSAYGKAAYYEHYIPEIEQLFSIKFDYLCDWNRMWFNFFSTEFELNTEHVIYTKEYIDAKDSDIDLRNQMQPLLTLAFSHKPYYNVFFDKFPQPQNLSVMDLLMNEGPHGRRIIFD